MSKKNFSGNNIKDDSLKSSHPDKNGLSVKILNTYTESPGFAGSNPGQDFSLETSLFDMLREFSKEKKMYFGLPKIYVDYKPPKLHRGRTSWYISYYVRDPDTGRFRLFRVKVNHFGSTGERIRGAKAIMADIQEKLSLGWNPIVSRFSPKASVPAFRALDSYYRVKEKEMELESLRSYKSYLKVFREWLKREGLTESTPICAVSELVAKRYMAFLEDESGVSPRTYNNYLSFQITLFDWMRDKGYVSDNVFAGIRRKPKRLMKKNRRLLNDDELNRLFSFLEHANPEFHAVCLLCYCCLMRPKEIALLTCADIDLEKQTVHVGADIAKNDSESFRTIPDAVLPAFRRLELGNRELFLFGHHPGAGANFRPSGVATDKKRFTDYWNRVIRPACGFGLELQLYSLKDTGITNMLKDGVAINLVQQQADHSSVAMTAIYVGKSPAANKQLQGIDILPEKRPVTG